MRTRLILAVGAVLMMISTALIGVRVGEVRASSHQEVVYIATGLNFPDALGVGSVAAIGKAPVLFVTADSIPGATLGELNRLQPDKIIIVGGTGVVSQAVADALAALSFNPTVERLAGSDRFSTAVEVSKSLFPAQLDADTLNGMPSSAFLGATAKAADADKLDGLNSTAFLGATAKAADADRLDGLNSTAFLGATAKAADSDRLDGLDSTAFLQPSQVTAVFASGDQEESVTATDEIVRFVSFTAPANGVVIASSSATGAETTGGDDLRCSITTGSTLDMTHLQEWESMGVAQGRFGQLSGTRGFNVTNGAAVTINLVCDHNGTSGSTDVKDSSLTAIFIPTG